MQFYGHKGLDKFLYEKYLVGKLNGIVMECGALDGLSLSNTKCLEEFGWTSIHIEPNPDEFKKLVANRVGDKNINLNFALSDKEGKAKLNVHRKAKGAHIIRADAYLAGLSNEKERGIKYEVDTKTYTQVIEQLKLTHIDLFVLDVEGFEPYVIYGMEGCNVLPDIFCVECGDEQNKALNYEQLIDKTFNGIYKKDSRCWYNDIYVKKA